MLPLALSSIQQKVEQQFEEARDMVLREKSDQMANSNAEEQEIVNKGNENTI